MKRHLITCTLSAVILTFSSGAAWSETDCSNAAENIANLQHEKKSTDERIAKGVFSITPVGFLANELSKSAKHDPKKEMEINEYNQKLTDKISEIKQNCNIQ